VRRVRSASVERGECRDWLNGQNATTVPGLIDFRQLSGNGGKARVIRLLGPSDEGAASPRRGHSMLRPWACLESC
jgi:hypothetical protein